MKFANRSPYLAKNNEKLESRTRYLSPTTLLSVLICMIATESNSPHRGLFGKSPKNGKSAKKTKKIIIVYQYKHDILTVYNADRVMVPIGIECRRYETELLMKNIRRCTQDACTQSRFHVDDEPFGQSCIEELHIKIISSGSRHQSAHFIQQPERDKTCFFGRKDDKKQGLYDEKAAVPKP